MRGRKHDARGGEMRGKGRVEGCYDGPNTTTIKEMMQDKEIIVFDRWYING
jgi:hypothetical protein